MRGRLELRGSFRFTGPYQGGVTEGELSGDVSTLNLAIQAAQSTADSAASAASGARSTANSALLAAEAAQSAATTAAASASSSASSASSVAQGVSTLNSAVTSITGEISTINGNISTINSALSTVTGSLCKLYHMAFDQTASSPATIVSVPVANSYIPMIIVAVNTPAGGSGATISIGQSNGAMDRYVLTTDVDLRVQTTTVIYPITGIGAYGGTIDLHVTAGGNTFAGEVFLLLSPITAQTN